jgi:hypothetical protein
MRDLNARINKLESLHSVREQIVFFYIPPYFSSEVYGGLEKKIKEGNYEDFERITEGWPEKFLVLFYKHVESI